MVSHVNAMKISANRIKIQLITVISCTVAVLGGIWLFSYFESKFLPTLLVLVISFASILSLFNKLLTLNRQQANLLLELENWACLSQIRGTTQPLTSTHNIATQINLMQEALVKANNVDGLFDQQLRQQVLLDADTGIGNREYFNSRLEALLKEEDVQGAVFFIHLNDLELIASLYGQEQQDRLLESVIQCIKKRLVNVNSYFIARRSEAELALLIPGIFLRESEKLASKILETITKIPLPVGINNEDFVHIGVSYFSQEEKPYQIKAETDMALRSAQLQGPSQWFMYDPGELEQESAKGSLRWRSFLEKAIDASSFVIFFQPVISSKREQTLHHEVLSKVRDSDGSLISARVFLPMASKCGLTQKIDLLVFEQVCRLLTYEANQQDDCSLNISIESLLSVQFIESLTKKLNQFPKVAKKLIIEVSEYHIVNNLQELLPVFFHLESFGIRLLADKVGQYVVGAQYLKTCPIKYLKLHRSIVLGIDIKTENQVFIQSLKTMAQSQNVDVYALGVETYDEWHTLTRLGVQGGQGHLFTEPVAQVAKAIRLP